MENRNGWWAIKYNPFHGSKEQQGSWMGPSLVFIDKNTMYWEGGPGQCSIRNWDTVMFLQRYDGDDDDVIIKQFIRDYPPEAGLEVSAGWLAPDGKFYPCRYMEHLNTAYELALVHYNSDRAEKELEDKGWAKIYSDGICILWAHTNEYTQKQIDTIGDLIVLATQLGNTNYADNLAEELI